MDSKQHFEVLQQVSEGSIPSGVNSSSRVPLGAVTDLVGAGYLTAAHASEGPDPAYLNLSITPRGREHLRRLRSLHPAGSIGEFIRRLFPPWLRITLAFVVTIGGAFYL